MKTARNSGFVLVGVVMFVLALTILGLSLFSLSSYESQFMTRSLAGEQAFHVASSGLAKARHHLIAKGILGDVAGIVGSDGITSAVAIQVKSGVPDSLGSVVFGGEDVCVRVTGTVSGESRRLEAWFQPMATSTNLYHRLMALSDPDTGLTVTIYDFDNTLIPPGLNFAFPRWPQTWLNGSVWQNAHFAAPSECDSAAQLPVFEASGGVPAPALASYFASRWAGATAISGAGNPSSFTLHALGSPDDVQFFKTAAPDADDSDWSLHIPSAAPEINVTGTAIWMFDRGAFFLNHVTVKGPASALLILVARPTTDPGSEMGSGLSFVSAIQSQGPGVVMISEGRVGIETDVQKLSDSNLGFVTIFAKRALIMGPQDVAGPGPDLRLSHPTGHALDTRLAFLWDNNYLPNATGSTGSALVFRPGSWRQYSN